MKLGNKNKVVFSSKSSSINSFLITKGFKSNHILQQLMIYMAKNRDQSGSYHSPQLNILLLWEQSKHCNG